MHTNKKRVVARRQPDIIIAHVGTDDLRSKDEKEIAQNISRIKDTIKEISPNTRTLISLIIQRYDNETMNDKVVFVNNQLMQLFNKNELIDNSNLGRDCSGSRGLHLNQLRNKTCCS